MAENTPSNQGFFYRQMSRTGRYYPIFAIATAQLLISYPGAALVSLAIQQNARFSAREFTLSAIVAGIFILLGNLLLIVVTLRSTRDVSLRLGQWKEGRPMSAGQVELRAWRQINALAWRYGAAAILVAILVDTLPLLAYQAMLLQVSLNQLIYTSFGSALAAIVVILSMALFIEFALRPARELLLPSTFEQQVGGAIGFRLQQKFVIAILGLIGFSILTVAPLGYSKTYQAIYQTLGSPQTLAELQVGFGIASLAAIVLGTILAFALSELSLRAFARPDWDLYLIEKGDMKQRARFSATDEIGELAIYFNRMITRLEELQLSLEKRVEEQTEKLRASNEVGRIASTILDPDVLVTQVVSLVAKTFGYYYVAVFLVSENGRWAEIKEATGAAGEALKARRHRLQVGGNSMVGSAIADHEAKVAMDVGKTAVRFNNPLLPGTRSELALPLLVGERVIGALDVQSTREADFKPDDIATLQNLASQVAVTIENARLFREMENALEELRQVNRQTINSTWTEKLRASRLEYSAESSLPPDSDPAREVAINLSLRDQPIGLIQMQINADWSHEDQAWVNSLATQVAISLENARLIEESSQSALRERLSASIIQKLWASSTVDGILQTAVRELGRALEASEATIEIKVEE